MKTISTLLLFLLASISFAQTIRRVTDDPFATGTNVYKTLQAAHDAATGGDIIYLEPNTVGDYPSATLTRKLIIYGTGYFLDVNKTLNANAKSPTIGSITLSGPGCNGTEISGITASALYINGASNIKLYRNYFNGSISIGSSYTLNTGSYNNNVSNITITNNYSNYNGIYVSLSGTYTLSNLNVTNNILPGATFNLQSNYITGTVIRNNTFNLSSSNLRLQNAVFENNILDHTGNTLNFISTSASNNVSAGSELPTGNGNQNSVDFVNTQQFQTSNTALSKDAQYQLTSSSTLKTAGVGGIEVGAFGGPTPYLISGVPAIPTIQLFNGTASGSSTIQLSNTVSVKANN